MKAIKILAILTLIIGCLWLAWLGYWTYKLYVYKICYETSFKSKLCQKYKDF